MENCATAFKGFLLDLMHVLVPFFFVQFKAHSYIQVHLIWEICSSACVPLKGEK